MDKYSAGISLVPYIMISLMVDSSASFPRFCLKASLMSFMQVMVPMVKRHAPQIEEVFENVQYVKLEFIDYMYRDAKKRLIGYIRDHGLRQQDLEGCLGDLLDEEWYKINI